jgi:hypothetical protein
VANLTITVSNRLGIYAGEPTNKWGTMVWGTDNWGWKATQWDFSKGIAESFILASSITGKDAWHLISEEITLDTVVSREVYYAIASAMSLSSAITVVNVINNGWILSLGEQTNALDWPEDDFTIVTDPTTTWTNVGNSTTSWAEL